MDIPFELRIIRRYINDPTLPSEYCVSQIEVLARDAQSLTSRHSFTAKVLKEIIRRCHKYKVSANAISNLSQFFDKLEDLSYTEITNIRSI